MDNDLLGKIFSVATAAWTAVCMAAVALFKAWPAIMARINERYRDTAAEKANDWQRIRDERDLACEERDMVRDRWAEDEAKHRREIAKCEAEKLDCERRAVTAEATLLGLGIGKNIAASQAAAERAAQKPEAHRDGGNG